MQLISVIIPARNEEKNIGSTLSNIRQTFQENSIAYEIIVVDDGSADGTAGIVKQCALEDKNIALLPNPGPHGIGRAIRLGLTKFRGDGVIIAMADGSDDPQDMVAYAWALDEKYDACFGSRWIRGGQAQGYPFFKLVLNRAANFLIQIMFRLPYNDITNAFKGYSRDMIERLLPLEADHFAITVEMPLKAVLKGAKYKVIPVRWCGRREGKTKWVLKELGSSYWRTLRELYRQRN